MGLKLNCKVHKLSQVLRTMYTQNKNKVSEKNVLLNPDFREEKILITVLKAILVLRKHEEVDLF